MTTSPAFAALLLGDGRFPSGTHAHSWGLEAAVAAGLVADLDDLRAWATGLLGTAWRVDASAAVLARRLAERAAGADAWVRLDTEVAARITSPQLRTAGRTLGRQLLRTGGRVWPAAAIVTAGGVHPDGPHAPLALGAVGAAAGLDEATIATLSLHGALLGATTAAIRLLGLDPYAVTALVAELGGDLAAVAAEAVAVGDDPAALPATGAPLLDLLLSAHATTEVRFFAT